MDPLTGLAAARRGLYIHFPYCLSKCPYCDFASVMAREVPGERYLRAVLAELELRVTAGVEPSRPFESIYLGGGTPSLWEPRLVGALLEAVAARFVLAEGVEVTLEANPGAADAERFAGYRAAGVNRLSMGVQSFQPALLAALGRGHDGAEAVAAYEAARRAGFDNVSLDFIYGVMGQTVAQARDDAQRAVSLGPEHLSAYALTLEKEALAEEVPLARQLARGEVTLPSDDDVLAMAAAVREALDGRGLRRYEISNYAVPGAHSRHNTLYWTGGEYLALGAGATGYLRAGPGPEGARVEQGTRYQNHRSAEAWFQAVESGRLPEAKREPLGREELFHERLAMGLRLTTGVALEAVCEAFGEPADARKREAERLVRDGFARWTDGRLALTERGLEVHSAICARLM